MARWEATRTPGVKVAPQPLADYSVSDAQGTVLSYFGYQFDVPWNASFKKRSEEGWCSLSFSLGRI